MRVFSKNINYEDCVMFKEEHANLTRTEVRDKYTAYYAAMKRLGCLDDLFPKKYKPFDVDIARKAISTCKSRSEFFKKYPHLYYKIHELGLQDDLFIEYEEQRDNRTRAIYAFEFAETHSVYVGLTYDFNRRKEEHFNDKYSAVFLHMKKHNITPNSKLLTDYIPTIQAKKEEGKWVKRYREEGWNILNRTKTGSIGAVKTKEIKDEDILKLHNEGYTIDEIGKILGASGKTIWQRTKKIHGYKVIQSNSARIKFTNSKGEEVIYESMSVAARELGVSLTYIQNRVKSREIEVLMRMGNHFSDSQSNGSQDSGSDGGSTGGSAEELG